MICPIDSPHLDSPVALDSSGECEHARACPAGADCPWGPDTPVVDGAQAWRGPREPDSSPDYVDNARAGAPDLELAP